MNATDRREERGTEANDTGTGAPHSPTPPLPHSPFIERLLGGWTFPWFTISLLTAISVGMLALLFIPESSSAFGAFATEFKIWCFGYDPSTGQLDWAYVIMMVTNPLMLVTIVAWLWGEPLREGLRHHRLALARLSGLSIIVVAMMVGGLFWMGPVEADSSQLTFPAERLRTQLAPPPLDLVDQNGDRVRLEDLRGRVVLLTGTYTTCHTACPMIITQAKRALATLTPEQKQDLTIVAVTLDPEGDTQLKRKSAAKAHDLSAPLFRYVGGEPDAVNAVLDGLNIARIRNEETGMIDHTNLFAVVDRQGRIAYRLTLSDRHDTWLATALKVLIDEAPASTSPLAAAR